MTPKQARGLLGLALAVIGISFDFIFLQSDLSIGDGIIWNDLATRIIVPAIGIVLVFSAMEKEPGL